VVIGTRTRFDTMRSPKGHAGHDRAWDVVVIGAGPAGSAAAGHLASRGFEVLIVDRDSLPRGKLCGSCLSIAAVREVHLLRDACRTHADIADMSSGAGFLEGLGGVPLGHVRLAAAGATARIAMPGGMVLSRDRLDSALLGLAIASGRCEFLPRMRCERITEFESSEQEGAGGTLAGVVVRLTDASGAGHDVRCRLAVVATGLADHVRIVTVQGTGVTRFPGGGLARFPISGLTRSASGTRAAGRRIRPGSRVGVGTVLPAGLELCDHPAVAGLPAGELVMAVGRDGYCGVVRLEDGRLDLAAAVDRASLARISAGGLARLPVGGLARAGSVPGDSPPASVVTTILREAFGLGEHAGNALATTLTASAWRATPSLSHTTPLVAGATGRVLRVGDAAGYVEPFTGEGIGWALASGRLLADAVTAPASDGAAAASDGAAAALVSPGIAAARTIESHARHFGRRYARCGRVARGLRMPVLVRAAVRAAGLAPWAARLVSAAVVGADRREAGA